MRRATLLGLTSVASVVAGLMSPGLAQAATAPSLLVGGALLDKATVGATSVATVQGDGVTAVRWSLDSGDYITDNAAPFELPLSLLVGEHRLRARVTVNGDETRLDAKF